MDEARSLGRVGLMGLPQLADSLRGIAPEPNRMPSSDSFSLLSQWRTILKANDLSANTIHLYTYGVWNLAASFDFEVHLLDMDESHIARFLAGLGNRSTCKEQYAKGIRSFYGWATRRGYLLVNPIGVIRPRRAHRADPERFELDELEQLLAAAGAHDRRRAFAILACLGLGARRTEFVNIRRADIDWGNMVVHLRVTKGSKPRQVDISPWAEQGLRGLLEGTEGELLLDIEPNTLNAWVHQAAVECGFPPGKKRHVHTLRATYASMLADAGTPVHVIAKLLGHASISTTSVYLAVGKNRPTKEAVQTLAGPLLGDDHRSVVRAGRGGP